MTEFLRYEGDVFPLISEYVAQTIFKIRCTKCEFKGEFKFPIRFEFTEDIRIKHFTKKEK